MVYLKTMHLVPDYSDLRPAGQETDGYGDGPQDPELRRLLGLPELGDGSVNGQGQGDYTGSFSHRECLVSLEDFSICSNASGKYGYVDLTYVSYLTGESFYLLISFRHISALIASKCDVFDGMGANGSLLDEKDASL